METYFFEPVVKTTSLERYRVNTEAVFREMPFVRNSLQVDIERGIKECWHECVLKLGAFLLKSTQKRMGTGSYTVPATWWQHLKESHFPAWLLRRFPVKHTQHTYAYETEIRLCPHADIAWPGGQHIDFMTYEDIHG